MKIRLALLLLLLLPVANAKVGIFYFYEKEDGYMDEIEQNYSYVSIARYNVSEHRDLYMEMIEIYNASCHVPVAFMANEWYCLDNEDEKKRFESDIKYFEGRNIPFPCENGTYNFPKPVCIAEFYNFSSYEAKIADMLNEKLEEIRYISIMKYNTLFEENASLVNHSIPCVVIGKNFFSLNKDSLNKIYREAKKYEKVGISCPNFLRSERNICLIFFYNPVCHSCREAKERLEWLKAKYPLNITEYNLLTSRGNKILFRYYKAFNVSRDRQGSFAIFIDGKYFYQISQFPLLEDEIRKYVGSGIDCPKCGKEGNAQEFFNALTIFTVITGGLLDGINPCAFATLVFFIAYLEKAKKERGQLLIIGISFSLAVFTGYFLIGMGILEFFYGMESIGKISDYIYIFAALFAITIGILNFRDFFKMDESKAFLQLPNFLKRKRGRIIKIVFEEKSHIFLAALAFIVGLAISTLEFVCTGQILFPIMAVIKSASPEKLVAIFYLTIYTFMFIVPLLIILSLFYFGYSSREIGGMQRKRHKYVKLATGFLLLFIGFYMLASVMA